MVIYYIKLFHTGADRHYGILMSLLCLVADTKRAKEKKKMIPCWLKNPEEKQNSDIILISVDGKGTVFLVKLKLQGKSFE